MEEAPAIQDLRNACLVVRYGDSGTWYNSETPIAGLPWLCYDVFKPTAVSGNRIFGDGAYIYFCNNDDGFSLGDWYSITYREQAGKGFHTDAPITQIFTIHPNHNVWHIGVGSLDGPGRPFPCKSQRSYESIDDAIQGVLEFYFGDPSWMNTPGSLVQNAHDFLSPRFHEWFYDNWERKSEKVEIRFLTYFTALYWIARSEKLINWLYVIYSRLRYGNPYFNRIHHFYTRRYVCIRLTHYWIADGSPQGLTVDERHIYIRSVVQKPRTKRCSGPDQLTLF